MTLRRFNESDIGFMQVLYACGRAAELTAFNFTEVQKQVFLAQQFNAQFSHYTGSYRTDQFMIVEVAGEPAGRLFVEHGATEIRIVDIALMPDYQGRGVGTYLLQQLFAQARDNGKPVALSVEQQNPARRRYERLGFDYSGDMGGIYLQMQWHPN